MLNLLRMNSWAELKELISRIKLLATAVLLLLFTRNLPRDGGMAEDHGAQKPSQSPGSGPEVVERQRAANE